MTRVIFLGTSGSTPTRYRSLPAIALERGRDVLLFDCGEGAQRQMMIHKVNISKIKAIFLTHVHGDHILGVAGLVRTLALNKRAEPLFIYVPKGGEGAVKHLMEFDNAIIHYKIEIRPIKGGEIYRGDGYRIRAFRVVHTVPTYGFAFIEDDRLRFIKEKASRAGLKGRMFSEIARKGSLSIGSRRITLSSVSRKVKGKKIVYATDTRATKTVAREAYKSDLLIHEATYSERYKALARERWHSTARQCSVLAKLAKVNMLVLTHISARYKDTAELLREARAVFKNTSVAQDGMVIEL
jgi:ribonuclease Z